MAATALVQTRIDPMIRDRAAEVLDGMGMTVSDAVRILLTRIAKEGALPAGFTVDPATHDAWFQSKVMQVLQNPRLPDARAEASARGPAEEKKLKAVIEATNAFHAEHGFLSDEFSNF